ncbi:peptide ABC transporter substrate-binding protein [Thermoanaerobacterium sp. DL9XJH110]|uniref:peptide ABC transporter substrate-binding protein n=1 Tax=Thermoanaerobacterium sp. DL9XJH110 TaxID=3386643 RepID=UPI003BB6F527
MKRKLFSFIALLVVVFMTVSVVAGCGQKQSSSGQQSSGANNASENKKVLTFSLTAEVPSLDQQLANSQPSFDVGKHIFEGLIRVHDGKIKPGMAESWEISPDGLTYTFHLRDAKWSDGSPVTAQDFEYGIKRLLDPNLASAYAFAGYNILNGKEYNLKQITDPGKIGVKAIDEKTLEIKLNAPTKYFLSYLDLMCFYPVKKEVVEKYGSAYATEADKMLYNGPFILKEWKHEQEMVLEKNPNYWDKDSIKLDEIRILQVGDPNTALSMYENGELDFVDIPMAMVEKYKQEGTAKVYLSGADDWIKINLNLPDKPWLANKNFRKALNYAIDREDYLKTATKGLYLPATRLVLPVIAGVNGYYADEYPLEAYPKKADLAKAKEYLQKAMKELNISDPSQISVEYKIQDDETSKLMAEALQDQITRNLGIKFNIKLVTYKQRLADEQKGDFELVYAGWAPDYDDPMTYMELWETNNPQNSGKYSNPKYDELIEKARVEVDPKKRAEMFYEAEKILLDDAPLVPLQFRQRAWLCKDNVKGIVRSFVGADIDAVYATKD